MEGKLIKIKNISRGDFHLALDFVREGKFYDLKPNAVVNLTVEEYNYLSVQCQGAFKKGFLEVIEIDETVNAEVIESENTMSDEDILKILTCTLPVFKKKIADITALNLMKDIRSMADEEGKKDTFMKAIDARIEELADGSILL